MVAFEGGEGYGSPWSLKGHRMRKLFTALLALGMMMTSFMAVSAQDTAGSASSSATGFDSPATFIDERGNEVATLSVSGIDPEFDDYSEYSSPERGYIYVAVNFTVTNVSGSSMIVEPYDFSLLDAQGRNNGRAYVSQDENPETALFEDDLALADGESAELTTVFQLPADVPAAALVWQPESGILVIIDISEGAGEASAVASGLNAPVTWTDDRGNEVATLEITGVNPGWEDYDEYSEPERGMHYVAVDFKVTNVSGSNLILEPYDFSLIDNVGLNNGRSWVDAAEGNEPLFTEDTPVAAGESYEGTIVFAMLIDMQPSAIMWQPDSGLIHLVNLNDAGGSEATPADSSPEASPAAEEEGDSDAAAQLTDAASDADAEEASAEEASAEEATADEDEGEAAASSDASSDEDEGEAAATSAAAPGTVTEVNGEAVAFNDVVGDENGEIRVVSTLDGWEDYDAGANPPVEGTRFVLVTVEVTITNGMEFPMSPLDFTINTESGGAYDGELVLQAEDAEVQITESGGMIPADEPTELTIPFIVPNDEVPVSVSWNTGQDEVELSLVP